MGQPNGGAWDRRDTHAIVGHHETFLIGADDHCGAYAYTPRMDFRAAWRADDPLRVGHMETQVLSDVR